MSIDSNNFYNQSIAIGTIAGLATPSIVKSKIAPHINNRLFRNLYNTNKLTKQEIDVLDKATDKAFDISGLAKHGVKLAKVNEQTPFTKPEQIILDTIDKTTSNENLREFKKSEAVFKYSAIKGYNSAFLPTTNEIMYNKEKMPLTAFHEMGHAMNKYQTKISKFLQESCRKNKKLAGFISLVAILAPSKSQQSLHPMSDEDKVIGKFRDNAGLLAAATYLPTIIEESSASYKGQKLAKKVLSPELAKKVRKCNAFGLSTYILSAVAMGVGTELGVRLKDAVIKNGIDSANKNA